MVRRIPLSNAVVKAIKANQMVLDFIPRKFELSTPEAALQYLENKKNQGSDFRMSDAIRVQTGVKEIEGEALEEDIENRVVERLKEVQEAAYQEAYQLGLDQGKKEAFHKKNQEIEKNLSEFNQFLTTLTSLKKEMVQQNESHLIQLLFHVAKRLAFAEIKAQPESIGQVVKECAEVAQNEEQIYIQISPLHMQFFEKLKTEGGHDFEFLNKVKFEPVENMSIGGCIIQTNYEQIDARFEERVDQLWEGFAEKLHPVKNEVVGGS